MKINRQNLKEWFELKGLSEITIKNYMFYFDHFNFNKLNQDYLHTFLRKYNNLVARAFIKNLLNYLLTSSSVDPEFKETLRLIDIPKYTGRKKKRYPDILDKDQVHMIASKSNNERDKIMVLLTFYCGLRVQELLNIKPYDFNWETWIKDQDLPGKLNVIGKGDKQRRLTVMPELMVELYHYIQDISKTITRDQTIFNIGDRRWQRILQKLSNQALGKPVNPHLLRHSCATFLERKGLDLVEIAKFLGHESVSTTQIYIHLNEKNLDEKIHEAFSNKE